MELPPSDGIHPNSSKVYSSSLISTPFGVESVLELSLEDDVAVPICGVSFVLSVIFLVRQVELFTREL
jgi:hypothetical protein